MYWRMAALSATSLEEVVLILEELLDEDEVIRECKEFNGQLIDFLRERTQIEQLIRYIVEEAPEEAGEKRRFKFPFVACEIFTCEVDIILKALVDDEEVMNLLFSFLEPKPSSHNTILAGYFCKVVTSLMSRKTIPFMQYLQAHQAIVKRLVDLIGVTSIMEVLVRLFGALLYSSKTESMKWIEEIDVMEMIVEKFSSSDCSNIHSNAADALCAMIQFAPPGLLAKIYSPSFIRRLFHYALEDSRPTSVLANSLSVCMFLLTLGTTYGSATMEVVEGMLESLGRMVKLLDVSSSEKVLVTTYGKLQPPLGNHRLKIVEFISVLLTAGSKAAEELINLGAIKRILELFFMYPYNNFLHKRVENIVVSCLESNNSSLVEHLLHECNLVGKILDAEKHFTLPVDVNKPTISAEGRSPPRVGNKGHLTHISNKLIQLANNSSEIRSHLQEKTEWNDWQTNVLSKRNALENIYQWECGHHPTALQDQTTDSDEDDYQNTDYDVATLENNLSQGFPYGTYNNDDMGEASGSLERDNDEDVLFDDESAEAILSSLGLDDDDDQESASLFANSNWFDFDKDLIAIDRTSGLFASTSSNFEETGVVKDGVDDVIAGEDDTATSSPQSQGMYSHNVTEPDATEPPSPSEDALAGKEEAAVGQVPAPINDDKKSKSSEETANDEAIGDKSSKEPGN